jgi:hypothetical protein
VRREIDALEKKTGLSGQAHRRAFSGEPLPQIAAAELSFSSSDGPVFRRCRPPSSADRNALCGHNGGSQAAIKFE